MQTCVERRTTAPGRVSVSDFGFRSNDELLTETKVESGDVSEQKWIFC